MSVCHSLSLSVHKMRNVPTVRTYITTRILSPFSCVNNCLVNDNHNIRCILVLTLLQARALFRYLVKDTTSKEMEFLACDLDELGIDEEVSGSRNGRGRGRLGRRRTEHVDDSAYKSKNLYAERRRRQKLSDRLLQLRALVPIITNLNKATIIEDAITYIEELEGQVEVLKYQLIELEASSPGEPKTKSDEIDSALEMKQYGIQEEVQVHDIAVNQLWIKLILEKKVGRFTRLVEAIANLGLEITDTSVTTSKGALLVTSCVEGTYSHTALQTKELLLRIMESTRASGSEFTSLNIQ